MLRLTREPPPSRLWTARSLWTLLIEHGIAVRKRTIELLEVDADAIAAIANDG